MGYTTGSARISGRNPRPHAGIGSDGSGPSSIRTRREDGRSPSPMTACTGRRSPGNRYNRPYRSFRSEPERPPRVRCRSVGPGSPVDDALLYHPRSASIDGEKPRQGVIGVIERRPRSAWNTASSALTGATTDRASRRRTGRCPRRRSIRRSTGARTSRAGTGTRRRTPSTPFPTADGGR